jgi:sodium-dependent dicarboxylate transporter 2/3/5
VSDLLTRGIVSAIGRSSRLEALMVVTSVAACALTNLMSNVATANILLPALACVGPLKGEMPLCVLTPVAFSISLALITPIGTPPNAIVLANGRVTVTHLLKVGSVCSGIFLITVLLYSIFVVPLLMSCPLDPSVSGDRAVLDSCGVS